MENDTELVAMVTNEQHQVEEREGRNKWIDIKMLPTKISYVLYYAAVGAWWPYMIIYLTSLGLTPFEGGFIIAIRTVVSVIASPTWGFIVDLTGKRKTILMVLCIGMTLFVFPSPFLAKHLNDFDRATPSVNISLLKNITSSFDVKNEYCTSKCGDRNMFWGMFGLFLVMGLFEYTIIGFLDSNVMQVIAGHTRKTNFGAQRAFGAVGFAVGSFIAGSAVDHYEDVYLSKFAAALFTFLPFSLIGIPFHMMVAKQAESHIKAQVKNQNNEHGDTKGLLKIVLKTSLQGYNFVFLISVLIEGTALAFMYGFLFLHMKDHMNSSQTIMGLSIVSSNIAEIIMFPCTNFLIERFGDMECLVFSIFTNAIRYFLLAFTNNAWFTLPIQLLHSTGFALAFTSVVVIVNRISPKEVNATMFGLVNSLYFGMASVVGNMFGGLIYEKYGGQFLFTLVGGITGSWGLFMLLFYFGHRLKERCE